MPTQDEIFAKESNGWFERNKGMTVYPASTELLSYLKQSGLTPKRILDVGCSNGHILHAISKFIPAECYGVEPSPAAIADGQAQFPEIHFTQGFSHDLSAFDDNYFDLVIVSFVLHWVDRAKLYTTIKEIDRVVSDRGHLIISDFDPTSPYRAPYHHLPEAEVYTYKQAYGDMFTSSNLYNCIFLKEFKHSEQEAFTNRSLCKIVTLQKRLTMNYPTL